MDKITLLEILKTEPFSFTLREIEEIMDEELSKTPDEMDTDLIDICADILGREFSKEDVEPKSKNQNRKHVKARRVLLIAAILILILSLSISASAKFLNIDASDKVVQFVNNRFHVNLCNESTDEDDYYGNSLELINDLNDIGFENISLPSALISKDAFAKTNTYVGENIENATIDFKNNIIDISGTISITKYMSNNDSLTIGQRSVFNSYNQVKQILVNGIDVLVFSDEINSYIYYIDKNIEYDITVNCNFDSAIEIAKTIE